MMPEQKPGKSRQDYGTPPEMIRAVQRRFGQLDVDLAAGEENRKAPRYVTKETDSLSLDWEIDFPTENCWLNPPFADIAPWAKKCAAYAKHGGPGRIFLLVPASVGSNWYAEHVHRKAYVIALQGRITFEGETSPYPKDCILAVYGSRIYGNEVWKWGDEL